MKKVLFVESIDGIDVGGFFCWKIGCDNCEDYSENEGCEDEIEVYFE